MRNLIAPLFATMAVFSTACLEPDPLPPTSDRICTANSDCLAGEQCVGGLCSAARGDSRPPVEGAAELLLLTESVRFKDVPRGRVETRALRLTNLGDVNLEVDSIEIPGASGRVAVSPDPDDFVLLVPPSGEYSLTVSFTGVDGVAFVAPIVLHNNDPLQPTATVPVVVDYTGYPDLIVTWEASGQHAEDLAGDLLDLGPQPAGVARYHRLFVKNLGIGGMFAVFEPPVLVGDAGMSIEMAPEPDTDGRYRLGRFGSFCDVAADCWRPAATCVDRVCAVAGIPEDTLVVDIVTTVTEGVTANAELRLPYAASAGGITADVRVTLSARGATAGLLLEPSAVDFGTVDVDFPESRLVHAFNLAAGPISVARVDLVGAGAAPPTAPMRAAVLDLEVPFAIPAYDGAAIRLDFVASADRLGDTTATLEVEIGAGTVLAIPVTGRARIGPQLITTPLTELDVGVTHIGVPAVAPLLIDNPAPPAAADLSLLVVSVTRTAGAGVFEVTPTTLPTVPPGQSTSLAVTCTPSQVGDLVGTLRLLSDAPDNPNRSLVVRCVGIDPDIGVSYPSRDGAAMGLWSLADDHPCRADPDSFPSPCADLGELYLAGAATSVITVRNTGVGPLSVSGLELDPPGAPFTLVSTPALPIDVLADGKLELEVEFQGAVMPALAETVLRLEHDDADRPAIALALLGSTTACDVGLRDCSTSAVCLSEQTSAACCRALDDPEVCLPGCTPCAPLSRTTRRCESDACVYACVSGWVDVNGNGDGTGVIQDGCEYACSPAGAESCDGTDNDCNGSIDDGLPLADAGGEEAPATCTASSTNGFLGSYQEGDLGAVTPGIGGTTAELIEWDGRIYRATGSPAGDEDWLRLVFAEASACAAVGFRIDIEVTAPDVGIELCGSARDPGGVPGFGLACDLSDPDDCVIATPGAAATLRFEWAEVCGEADDRVLDVRVRGVADGYACEPYQIAVAGARLY